MFSSNILINLKITKYITYTCMVLIFLIVLSGCAAKRIPITQSYDAKVSMTKDEAVQYLKHLFRNLPYYSVNENRLYLSFNQQVMKEKSTMWVNGVPITMYDFPYESHRVSIYFEDVAFIQKMGKFINLYDIERKCITCGDIQADWGGETFISALLALCSNVK